MWRSPVSICQFMPEPNVVGIAGGIVFTKLPLLVVPFSLVLLNTAVAKIRSAGTYEGSRPSCRTNRSSCFAIPRVSGNPNESLAKA
jgi:hypothetical protein